MELLTVSHVSKALGISAQMLRYYERGGLVESLRKEGYAYRMYDNANIKRLQQIVILRKLQIPLKQVKDILDNQSAAQVVDVFEQKINKIDEQVTALSTIRSILTHFVDSLRDEANVHLKLDLLTDKTMYALLDVLPFSENKVNENLSIDELNKAIEVLGKHESESFLDTLMPISTLTMAERNVEPGKISVEIKKCGPYRFIGKSVAARGHVPRGSSELFRSNWHYNGWVFSELDKLSEYASDEPYNCALITWEHYNGERGQLSNYTVGRFMKPDTPVPDEMDYYDLPELHVAKCFAQSHGDIPHDDVDFGNYIGHSHIDKWWDAIDAHDNGKFEADLPTYSAEVYPETPGDKPYIFGYYIGCKKTKRKDM